MKKMLLKLFVCIMCFGLVACGGKPGDVSQEVYEKGIKIIEVTENYLNADLTYTETVDKLSFLKNQIEITDKSLTNDSLVYSNFRTLNMQIITNKNKEIEGTLNEIKDLLGK